MNETGLSYLDLHRQNGFVLVMSLLFLLLLTIIGVTAMNTTSLEEKMAHNVKDKNLSTQASESALTMVETWLATQSREKVSNAFIPALASPTDGFNRVVQSTDAPIWNTMDWTASSGDFIAYPAVPWGVAINNALSTSLFAAPPRYTVEYVTVGQCDKKAPGGESGSYSSTNIPCNVLYITSVGVGGTTAATSMSQSSFNIRVK